MADWAGVCNSKPFLQGVAVAVRGTRRHNSWDGSRWGEGERDGGGLGEDGGSRQQHWLRSDRYQETGVNAIKAGLGNGNEALLRLVFKVEGHL